MKCTETLQAEAALAIARAYDRGPERVNVAGIADAAPRLVIECRDLFPKGNGVDPRRAAALAWEMDGHDEDAALRRVSSPEFRELLEKTNMRGRRYACIGGTATIRNK